MAIMEIDGWTAAVVAPVLERQGMTMRDFAWALGEERKGAATRYPTHFTTGPSIYSHPATGNDHLGVDLHAPGPGRWASERRAARRRIVGMPLLSGLITMENGRYRLEVHTLHVGGPVAMMVPRTGRLLLLAGTTMPDTICRGLVGEPLSAVASLGAFHDLSPTIVQWVPDAIRFDCIEHVFPGIARKPGGTCFQISEAEDARVVFDDG